MSYIGRGLETGSMRQLDDISSGFDGSDTTHTMQINSVDVDQSVVGDVNQLILSLGGVIQNPGTDFTVSGSTLTFTTAPAANTSFFCVVIGGGGGFATPGDKTVTEEKFNILDGKSIKFGTDDEVELTHNADKGLILKHKATADDKPVSLTLQTGETDIAADDVIGKIEFQAPDEGTGTDAILVAAGIQAVSEGDFSSSSNATKLSFLTGASEAAAEKMSIASTGATTITTSGNEDTLTLKSTDADATEGPNLILQRDSGSPADGDDIGRIDFDADNDAGEVTRFVTLRGNISDASNGSEDGQFLMQQMIAGSEVNTMRVKPDEIVFNDSSIDMDFRVESNDNTHCLFVLGSTGDSRVGINNNNPSQGALSPRESVANYQMVYAEHTASYGNVYGYHAMFTAQDPDNNTSRFFAGGSDAGGNRFLVYADGDVVNHDNSYGSTSDERIKSNIVDANSQWDDIKALKVRNYKKNDDITKYGDKAWVQLGVIAQELEASGMDKLVKDETKYESGDLEVVKGDKNVGDIKEYKSVKYSVLYMKAIKALQEAQTRIETLETKVAALEG